MEVLEGALWGLVGGIALLVGAAAALAWTFKPRLIGQIMAFGSGVLISAVAFELTEESFEVGGTWPVALGLVLGASAYVAGDVLVRGGGSARSITLGAMLDGIPESIVIGVSAVSPEGVSAAVVVAVFLSNVPESLAAAADFRKEGWRGRRILGLWAAVCVGAFVFGGLGAGVGDVLSGEAFAAVNAFAGGAVLAMLANTMIPDAYEETRGWPGVGLLTVAGFGLAFLLSAAG